MIGDEDLAGEEERGGESHQRPRDGGQGGQGA